MPLLVIIAVGWLVGLMVGQLVPLGAAAAPAALAAMACGLALSAWARHRPQSRTDRWGAPVLGALALVGGLSAARPAPRPPSIPRGLVRITARVDTSHHAGRASRSHLRVVGGKRVRDGRPVPAGATLRLHGRALPAGAEARLLARLTPRAPFRNPSPHPAWPAWRPVSGTARIPPGAPVRVVSRPWPQRWLARARAAVRAALERDLGPRTAAIARAVVLGEGRAVAEGDRRAVRDAGVAHVLAVSGLHVAIVAGLLAWIADRLWRAVPVLVRRWPAARAGASIGIPAALGFAAFAGGAPSAWRAAITAALGWGLVVAGRRPRSLPLAAGAATLLAAIEPDQVLRPGFLLSVAATVAIVTAPGEGGWLRRAFVVSGRAMVATAPVVTWCFGSVPAVGLVANVVIVPIASLLLVPGAAVHASVATALPLLGPVTALPFDGLARAFVAACATLARVQWGRGLPPPDVLQGVAVAAACIGLLAARGWRARAAIALGAALAVGGAEAWLRHREQPTGGVRVTFLDVGQGDAALVDLPDGRLMLIDAGGAVRGRDPGARVLAPLLAARRRTHIDVAVITHGHPDHFAGLGAILGEVTVGQIWTTRQATIEAPDGPLARILARARASGTRVRHPDGLCGRKHAFGQAWARVLWPCPGYDAGYGPNDNSLVVQLGMGRRRLLFAGDVEAHAEAVLVRAAGPALRADVLKVPHHGSATSSTPAFLAAVRPRLAVISAGLHNRFDHPDARVVKRYRAAGAFLARTDRMGGTVVRTDGRTLALRTWNALHRSLP